MSTPDILIIMGPFFLLTGFLFIGFAIVHILDVKGE